MSDVFVSYARSTAQQAHAVAHALRTLGYGVWRDDELPAHRAYSDVIDERLTAAKAVLVIWSAEAVKSEWVRSEANRAREAHKLVQMSLDGAALPLPFDQIQCADLSGWSGDVDAPGWRKVVTSIEELMSREQSLPSAHAPSIEAAPWDPKQSARSDSTVSRRASNPAFRQRIAVGALLILLIAAGAGAWYTFRPMLAQSTTQVMDTNTKFAERPAIAVLPFENLSDDPKQAIFADGLTEDLITRLSTWRAFPVIGRGSSFHYRGDVNLEHVAAELGVRYVVQGSVRRAADRIRVTAQLVDAQSGENVWSQRYDREVADVFALQDEISGTIAASLVGDLTRAEAKRARQRGTSNLEAWSLFEVGLQQWGATPQANAAARKLFEQAVALEPLFATAQAWLSLTQQWEVVFGISSTPEQDLAAALATARRAVELDARDPDAHAALSQAFQLVGDLRNARDSAQRAVDLNPSSPFATLMLGFMTLYTGDPTGSLALFEHVIRLDPQGLWVPWAHEGLAEVYWELGRFDAGLEAARKTVAELPDYYLGYCDVAMNAVELGRLDEARAAIAEGRRLLPNLSQALIQRGFAVSRPAIDERRNAALKQAGLD